VIDFHNALDEPALVDLVFDRSHFPGTLALLFSKLEKPVLEGFRVVRREGLEDDGLRDTIGNWSGRACELLATIGDRDDDRHEHMSDRERRRRRRKLCKIARLDHSHVLVAEDNAATATVGNFPGAGRCSVLRNLKRRRTYQVWLLHTP
jgi:hypothetical protein